jgi:hypothetical protein
MRIEKKYIRLKDIKPYSGPKFHDALPAELVPRAKALWLRVGPYRQPMTEQEWLDGFCYDLWPENDIRRQEIILNVLDRFVERHPDCDRKTMYVLLCGIAMGIPSSTRPEFEELRRIFVELNGGIEPVMIIISRQWPERN